MPRDELEIVRKDYNTVRLHAGVGYVAPDDEHEGPGIHARKDGLKSARQKRIAYRHQKSQLLESQNED